MIEKPKFTSPFDNALKREREAIAYLAQLVGEDGGAGLDILEGWCHRLAIKIESLESQLKAARNRLRNTQSQLSSHNKWVNRQARYDADHLPYAEDDRDR